MVSFCCVCRRWNELAHSAVFTVPMLYVRPDKWRALMGDVQRWKMAFRGLCVSSAKQTWSVRCTADDFPACKTSVEGLFEVIRRFLGDSAACRRFERLRELHLGGLTKATGALNAAASLFAHLEVLSLPHIPLESQVISIINRMPTIRHLNMLYTDSYKLESALTLPNLEEALGLPPVALKGLPNPHLLRVVVFWDQHTGFHVDFASRFSELEFLYCHRGPGFDVAQLHKLKYACVFGVCNVPALYEETDYLSNVTKLRTFQANYETAKRFEDSNCKLEPLRPIEVTPPEALVLPNSNAVWILFALKHCAQQLEEIKLAEWTLCPNTFPIHSVTFASLRFEKLTSLILNYVGASLLVDVQRARFPVLRYLEILERGSSNLLTEGAFSRENLPELKELKVSVSVQNCSDEQFERVLAPLLNRNLMLELSPGSRCSPLIMDAIIRRYGPFQRVKIAADFPSVLLSEPILVHHDTPDGAVFEIGWARSRQIKWQREKPNHE